MKRIFTLLMAIAGLGLSAQNRGISPPAVTTTAASSVGATGATLNGTVNPQGTATTTAFEFGTTTAYGSTVAGSPGNIAGGGATVPISYVITGALVPNTLYHYRAKATNGGGTGLGADMTFNSAAGTVCTPDAGITSGMGPASASVPCVQNGVAFSQTYTFVIPAQVTSVQVDSVVNLPTGLSVGFSQTPAIYTSGQTGCMLVTGISNSPCGQYQILIYVTLVTQLGTSHGELSNLGAAFGFQKLWLRVIDAGGTCPALNTAQTATFAAGTCGQAVVINPGVTKTNVLCKGESTGSATANPSGGTSYTYVWSNGATTSSINNLPAGSYSVTVSEGVSSASASVTIDEPASVLSVTTSSTTTSCSQSTGSATVTPAGGTPGYIYVWGSGGNTATINNVAAGNYQVTVYDAHNCSITASVTVNTAGGPSATATPTNPNCAGGTGSVNVTVTGGTGTITYHWNNNASTQNLTNVVPGTYTLTVSDANNCSFTVTSTVSAPAPIVVNGTATATTGGQSNGGVDITVTGGTGSYTYGWNNSATTQDLTSLAAGVYTVTVTDQNSCSATASFNVAGSVGIAGLDMINDFSVFPNPATTSVNVKLALTESLDVKVELIDVTGKVVMFENAGKTNQLNYVMNTSALPNGVYAIRISGSKLNVVKQITIAK